MGNKPFNPKCDRHATAMFDTGFFKSSRNFKILVYDLIKEFEDTHNRPPYVIEIMQIFRKRYDNCLTVNLQENMYYTLANYLFLTCCINDMHREDILYADIHQDQLATRKWNSKFDLISHRFTTDPRFEGLKLRPNTSLTSSTREEIDWADLKSLFLSTDMDAYAEYKEKFFDDHVIRFMNNKPNNGDRVSYNTYTRSGNTFLRKYIEIITGIVTGSEFTNRIPFPLQLQGLIGEHVVDDSVFVIKCHYPLRFGGMDYSVNKILSCVRSPFSVIRSNFEFF